MNIMDMDTIISMISAIIAVIAAMIGVFQSRKNWYINCISKQRLEWAENVRITLHEFVSAYYDKKDLRKYYYKILLYLNPNNSKHKTLVEKLNRIIIISKLTQCNDADIDDLIVEARKLLRYNWWTVKTESTISVAEEVWRDEKTKRRMKYYEEQESKNTCK